MPLSREDVAAKVQEVLVEALAVDDEEVTPDATLEGDLGAESIDYLDIVFHLEKAFSIKINKVELFPEEILSNPDYVDNGRMTPEGLQKLTSSLPHADFSRFALDPDVDKIRDVFTVSTIVNFVERKLADAPQS